MQKSIKSKKRNITPSRFIVNGLIVYFILFVFGPFKYTVYSISGLLYFVLCFFLLFFGSYLVEKMGRRYWPYRQIEIKMSKASEKFINIISIISILSFFIYFMYVYRLPNLNFEFGVGDLRPLAQANRPISNKIAEVLMELGIVAYLFASGVSNFNYRSTKFLSIIAFLLPAIALLAIGARGKAVITMLTYLIILYVKRSNGMYNKKNQSYKAKSLIWFVFAFMIIIIGKLFTTRGSTKNITDMYLMYPGDMEVKSVYLWLDNLVNHKFTNLYKGFHYYVHSLPFFTWIFSASSYSKVYYGAFKYRILGFLLPVIGINFPRYLEIVYSQPFYGYYTTFVQGYLLDWGLYLTPIFVFFTGIFFGLMYTSFRRKGFGYFIFPIILMMCFVSPVYYFWHITGTDFVWFFYILIYPIMKLLGLKRVEVDTCYELVDNNKA